MEKDKAPSAVLLLLLRDVAAVSAAADFNARRHLAKGR